MPLVTYQLHGGPRCEIPNQSLTITLSDIATRAWELIMPLCQRVLRMNPLSPGRRLNESRCTLRQCFLTSLSLPARNDLRASNRRHRYCSPDKTCSTARADSWDRRHAYSQEAVTAKLPHCQVHSQVAHKIIDRDKFADQMTQVYTDNLNFSIKPTTSSQGARLRSALLTPWRLNAVGTKNCNVSASTVRRL